MAEGPDSQAIKNLLDNPVVSDDVKRELIWAYGSRHGDRAPDLQRYADRLGMTGTGIPVPLGRPIGDLDKAVDDVYKELNKHEAENGKQVLGEAGNEASSSNSILDLGAPGLRYFEYFGPLYQKCVVGTEICRDKACQLYDEQRDMNLGVLRTDSAILTEGAAKLSEEITTQRNAWSTVDQLWTGQGAEAANSYVDGYLGQAGTAQEQVEKFATVLRPAADALENAVRDKAQFVAMLYADTIGGKTPDQIDEIIYYTQHGHDIVTSLPEAARIVHMFGALHVPPLNLVKQLENWLEAFMEGHVFISPYTSLTSRSSRRLSLARIVGYLNDVATLLTYQAPSVTQLRRTRLERVC